MFNIILQNLLSLVGLVTLLKFTYSIWRHFFNINSEIRIIEKDLIESYKSTVQHEREKRKDITEQFVQSKNEYENRINEIKEELLNTKVKTGDLLAQNNKLEQFVERTIRAQAFIGSFIKKNNRNVDWKKFTTIHEIEVKTKEFLLKIFQLSKKHSFSESEMDELMNAFKALEVEHMKLRAFTAGYLQASIEVPMSALDFILKEVNSENFANVPIDKVFEVLRSKMIEHIDTLKK